MSKEQSINQSIMSKFCKVCFEAGKVESIFKSHFVRSGPGMNCPVVCPTLLATECKYCHKAGHTVKYFDVLKNNEKQRRRERFVSRVPTAKAKSSLKDKKMSSTPLSGRVGSRPSSDRCGSRCCGGGDDHCPYSCRLSCR